MSFRPFFSTMRVSSASLRRAASHLRLLAPDAAGGVEPVEAGRQLLQAAVDVAGVIVPRRQLDLLAVLSDLLDEGLFRLAGQQAQVGASAGTVTPSVSKARSREQIRAWAYST